jgi:uncharacterized repeat protein (TIGR03803 family)
MKPKKHKFTFAYIALIIFGCANIHSQCSEFYGMTLNGGEFDAGAIFKTDSNGNNFSIVYSMTLIEGTYPFGGLCKANNGKLYGMTELGGVNDDGVIFEWNPVTNKCTKRLDLISTYCGSNQVGTLIQANNGKFYGMAYNGGKNDDGVIFEWDPVKNYSTIKIDFKETESGCKPQGSLIQADNGKIYGMTKEGGANNLGVLFELDPTTNTYSKKLDFNGTENGRNPYGSLIQTTNGKLYGSTSLGGEYDSGVLFEWDPATDTYTKRLDFNGPENGSWPSGSLIQADNGKLYGITSHGGTNNEGVLFEWDPATNTYTKKLDFNQNESGYCPSGSLIQTDNGKLYGFVHQDGETFIRKLLFEWDPATNIYTKKYFFDYAIKGVEPTGFLIQADNGKLYGLTSDGGLCNYGVLFEWDPATDTYTKKIDFNWAEDGANPEGSLIQAGNGKLYGMAGGGICGVLFECDPTTYTYTKIHDFNGGQNGGWPYGSLIQADNGKLYGMTHNGGSDNKGVLFEYDPAIYTYNNKYSFVGCENGCYPYGSLMQADNGKLYGMTHNGGANGLGVLFEWDPAANTYIKKLDFNGINGQEPRGSLIQAHNGKIYGMTMSGGIFGYLYRGEIYTYGVLFEWDPATDTYTKNLDFNGAENGGWPYGSLIQADNGKLYGMTSYGGTNYEGVLFEWDPVTDTYTKKLDFNIPEKGGGPRGSLMQAANGKLYGMTSTGGYYRKGLLFEYNLATDTFTDKFDFSGIEKGSYPHGSLIETCRFVPDTEDTDKVNTFKLYPNPNNGSFSIDLGSVYSNAVITIIEIDGRTIQKGSYNDVQVIQLKMYIQSGIYMLIITTDNEKAIFKIIIN